MREGVVKHLASLEQLSLGRKMKMFSDQTKMSVSETDELESARCRFVKRFKDIT